MVPFGFSVSLCLYFLLLINVVWTYKCSSVFAIIVTRLFVGPALLHKSQDSEYTGDKSLSFSAVALLRKPPAPDLGHAE